VILSGFEHRRGRNFLPVALLPHAAAAASGDADPHQDDPDCEGLQGTT
jgi:hypothetical protein